MAGQTLGSLTTYWAPKHIGDSLGKAIGGVSKTVFKEGIRLNEQTREWDLNTAAYAKSFAPKLDELNNFFANAGKGLTGIETSVNSFYADALNTTRKQVGDFSDHLGGVVTDLSGIVRNPLDFQNVSNCAASIMNRIWPGSSDNLNQTIQNLHLDKLAKAPGLLFTGLQRLARAIDNILSIPIAFVSSVYYGVIGLIKEVGKLINSLLNGFQQFLFNFLDEIIPLTEIIQLLNDIGTLAGQIQGLATAFGGANIVAGFALQINTFTNQVNTALSNPLQTVLNVLPQDVQIGYSQIMNNLRNPETIIGQLIPADLQAIFSKITSITGFGLNGNIALGFGELLDGVRGGVISSILSNYAAQYRILAPLLGGGIGGGGYEPPLSYNPATDNGYIQGKRYQFNPDTNLYELV